jgi:hypothetical protein
MLRDLIDAYLHWPIGCAPVFKAIPLRILMAVQW